MLASPAAFRRTLLAWYSRHGRDLPWRRTRDPYAILVSEIMLQQTPVATVIPYYERWLRRFPDFASLAAAPQSDVLHAWQGLGYYARARNLHAAAKAIVAQHGGDFPRDIEEARKLPGLGRYTANAVATFAFDSSVPIIEANTARLLARLTNLRERIDSSSGRDKLWSFAASVLPTRAAGTYNSALMDLGATVCTAGEPKCDICPVHRFCHADAPALLPIKKARAQTKALTERHLFALRRGRILLEQSAERWRGMWILPRLNGDEPGALLHRAAFPFTHHRITLDVFANASRARAAQPGESWFVVAQTNSIPMPSPHRRALEAILRANAAREHN